MRRREVPAPLMARCVSHDQAVPTYGEFAAEWRCAQRRCRAAEDYSKAFLARCAAEQHLAAAAQLCKESEVVTGDLERDLESWRHYSAIDQGKRLRSDEAEEQRRTFDSLSYDRLTAAYEVLEPDGDDAQAARQRREVTEAREARVAEQRAHQAAAAASGGAAGPPRATDWRLAGV